MRSKRYIVTTVILLIMLGIFMTLGIVNSRREMMNLIKEEARSIRQGRQAQIGEVIGLLKAERELRGLSLADIGERTGLSKSAISKLENNEDANPTINTLTKYADALGMALGIIHMLRLALGA